MDLDGVMDLIKAEASLWMPRHQRRMALLKVRKTGTQDDFLQQLERMMAVTEWEIISTDEMQIHLFSEERDGTMSRAAMEILASNNSTVAALWTTNSRLWNRKQYLL